MTESPIKVTSTNECQGVGVEDGDGVDESKGIGVSDGEVADEADCGGAAVAVASLEVFTGATEASGVEVIFFSWTVIGHQPLPATTTTNANTNNPLHW